MKQITTYILDVVEQVILSEDVRSYVDKVNKKESFENTPPDSPCKIDTQYYPIKTLKRIWHEGPLNDPENFKERLPDFAKEGEVSCEKDSQGYTFTWIKNYVIKDKVLREYVTNLEDDINTLQGNVEFYKKLSNDYSHQVNDCNNKITEQEQHPIKFMFKQIVKNRKGEK